MKGAPKNMNHAIFYIQTAYKTLDSSTCKKQRLIIKIKGLNLESNSMIHHKNKDAQMGRWLFLRIIIGCEVTSAGQRNFLIKKYIYR